MYCTSCGTYLHDEYQFCIHCGRPRPAESDTGKGTRWVPLTITALLFILGSVVYYFSMYVG